MTASIKVAVKLGCVKYLLRLTYLGEVAARVFWLL